MSNPMPPRRRWPWVVAGMVFVLVLAAVLLAPHITCRLVQRQCPIPGEGVVIRGAQYGGNPASAAMVVGQCSPGVFRRIVEGASGCWVPGLLLGAGQHAWGTFTDAPEITWRLDLDATADEPHITARIPQAVAERLLAAQLKQARSPLSQVKLAEFSLSGKPQADDIVWLTRLRGTAMVFLWNQPSEIEVESLDCQLKTKFMPRPDGDLGLTAQFDLKEMRGTSPFGPLTPFSPLLEKQVNQGLGRKMPKILVPGWMPTATHWDLQIVPGEVEF